MPRHKAEIAAACLVASNLRGVDSHGIQLLPFYIDQIWPAKWTPQTDGARDLGVRRLPAFRRAERPGSMGGGDVLRARHPDRAAQRGRRWWSRKESNHFGAAAWWAQKMRDGGQIGIVMCNASPIVPPWQGKEGPARDESDLHVGARALAAGYGDHDGRGGQDFQGVSQRPAGDSRRAGRSIPKAFRPPTRRPPTRAC